jgi:hypothetical protein
LYRIVLITLRVACVVLALVLVIYRNRLFEKRYECALLIGSVLIFFILAETGTRIYMCNFAISSLQAYSTLSNDYEAAPHYQAGFEEHNRIIENVAAGLNSYFYDFRSHMPMDKECWNDGRHVVEKGAELKGKLFADFILTHEELRKKIENRLGDGP